VELPSKNRIEAIQKIGRDAAVDGRRVLFPLSLIISIEHEAISKFAARETKVPEQLAQARERRGRERQARRLRKRTAAIGPNEPGNQQMNTEAPAND
jgi:hypothetical protein